MRILVVDDDPDLVLILCDWLRLTGHDVRSASDGQAALAALQADPPDLAILDVDMPKLNGVETLRRIKKRWTELPVIMMTAHGTIQLAVTAMQEGANDFITKPFEHAQLDATIAKALECNEIKSEITRLLGTISHDTKNLLMPIVSGTDLLSEELVDLFKRFPEIETVKTQESHRLCDEIIDMLRTASRRIQAQMKEIADYVKAAQAPRRFAPCRIGKIMESVELTLRPLVRQKHITLKLEDLDTLPSIMADEVRLYSAFYNLACNAIPEVPPEGSITIRGRFDQSAESVVVTFQDTGKGMPPEIRDSLFTTGAISRKIGGSGLGTKIVKDAINVHGGLITVQSEQGRGTTFEIRLPVQAPLPLAVNASPPIAPGASGR
jgi:signal transduction histidine kinase